jgi:hypothetical protein
MKPLAMSIWWCWLNGVPAQDVFKELEQAECKGAPAGLDHVDQLFWSRKQIIRRLKKVSRKLSLHDEDDLRALGAPYQTVCL